MIKALDRLALQQETALNARTAVGSCLFNRGIKDPFPMLDAAAQKWNNDAQNSAVWLLDSDAPDGALGHRERGIGPFAEKSGGDETLELLVSCTREPGSGRSPGPSAAHQTHGSDHGSAAIAHAAPHDTSVSCYQPLTTGVATFQLDISNRTSGHQQVWECLETLTGLTALQVIGLQLRRDTLKQSPAAALVQQALADCS